MNIYDYDISDKEMIQKELRNIYLHQVSYSQINLQNDTCLITKIITDASSKNGHNIKDSICILGSDEYVFFNKKNKKVYPTYKYIVCVSSDTWYIVKSMYDSKSYISCIKSKFLRTFCIKNGNINIYKNKHEYLYYLIISVFTTEFPSDEYPFMSVGMKSVEVCTDLLKCKLNDGIIKIGPNNNIFVDDVFNISTINYYDAVFQEYHLNSRPMGKEPDGFTESNVYMIDNNILCTSFTDNFVWTYDIELNNDVNTSLRHLYKLLDDWSKLTHYKCREVFLDKTNHDTTTFFYDIIQKHFMYSCYGSFNLKQHDCSISTQLCNSPKQRLFTICIPLSDHNPIQKVILGIQDDSVNNINSIVIPLNTKSISVFNYNLPIVQCDNITNCIFLHVYEYIGDFEYFNYWEDYQQYPRRPKPFLSSLVSSYDMSYNLHAQLKQYKKDRIYEIKQNNMTLCDIHDLYEKINENSVIHFIKTEYKHTEIYRTEYVSPILPNFYLKPEMCTEIARYVESGGIASSPDIKGIVTSIIDLLNVNYNSNYKIHKSFFNLYNNDIPYENKYCEKVMFDSNNNYTYITLHLNDTYEYKENIKKERVGTLSFVNCYQNEIINEISSGHKITFTIILKERICSKNTLLIESEVSELLDMIMTLGISKDFTKIEENKVIDINTSRMSPWQVQYVIWKNELLKSSHVDLFDTITKIRRKIIDKYIIDTNHIYDDKTIDDDFIYIIKPGHFLAKHTDNFNHEGGLYLRFNVLLLEPDIGGVPLYDSRCYFSDVGDVLICNAGDYYHETTAVQGTKSRVTVSIGIVIKKEFKYLYNDLY